MVLLAVGVNHEEIADGHEDAGGEADQHGGANPGGMTVFITIESNHETGDAGECDLITEPR